MYRPMVAVRNPFGGRKRRDDVFKVVVCQVFDVQVSDGVITEYRGRNTVVAGSPLYQVVHVRI